MYDKSTWEDAFESAVNADWDEVDIQEGEHNFLAGKLLEVYESDKVGRDESKVWAVIQAAGKQFREFDADQLDQVFASYSLTYDGWGELAQEYIDEHYPNFPVKYLDMEKFGQEECKRESEVYVEDENSYALHVFQKVQ